MRLLPLLLPLVATLACSGPGGRTVTPTELAALERQAPPPAPASEQAATPQGDTLSFLDRIGAGLTDEQLTRRDELDRKRVELDRKRADHARALFELDARTDRVDLEHAAAIAAEVVALAGAELELRVAKKSAEHFIAVEQSRRLREDALGLQASADGLLETREELAQLEMMYSDSQLGDATAEIVVSRTRRRLARAEESHALRSQRSRDLAEIDLPRERARLMHEQVNHQMRLDNVRRNQEKARLEREAALRELAHERTRLERQAQDHERELRTLERDVRRFERELALANALTGDPAGAQP